jgi:hypothetical protein
MAVRTARSLTMRQRQTIIELEIENSIQIRPGQVGLAK